MDPNIVPSSAANAPTTSPRSNLSLGTLTSHTVESHVYYDCKFCPLSFTDYSAYVDHVSQEHSSIYCFSCRKFFKMLIDANNHPCRKWANQEGGVLHLPIQKLRA